MTANYPDVEVVFARLAEENPPAHVRAQRLAELHIAMAEASHGAVLEALAALQREVQAIPTTLKTQRDDLRTMVEAAVKRSSADAQRTQETRLSTIGQAVEGLRQQMGTLGQSVTWLQYFLAVTGGMLAGALLLAAVWFMLGQTVWVQLMPALDRQVHQRGGR